MTRQTVERGQTIDDEIGLGRLLDQFLNMFASGDVVSDVS